MTTVIPRKRLSQPVTDDVLKEAVQRGTLRAAPMGQAKAVKVFKTDDASGLELEIQLSDGVRMTFPVAIYPELNQIAERDLAQLKLGFGGTAICLPEHDLHVSIAGLVADSPHLLAIFKSANAARLGRSTSEAKSVSSRANGRLGGRPRKPK